MDRLTWRPALVIFWSATAQNNAPQYMYNLTAVIEFYETSKTKGNNSNCLNGSFNRVETTEAE